MAENTYTRLTPEQVQGAELKYLKAYIKVCVELFVDRMEAKDWLAAVWVAEDMQLIANELHRRASINIIEATS